MSEIQIKLFLNIFVFLVSLWAILYVYNKYILIAYLNSKRFKLFALRDRLAFMVMKGDLNQDSAEYEFVNYSINYYIAATENFEVMTFIRSILKYSRNKELQQQLEVLLESIEGQSQEFKDIFYQYHLVLDKIFGKRLYFAIWLLKGLLGVLISINLSVDIIERALNACVELLIIRDKLEKEIVTLQPC